MVKSGMLFSLSIFPVCEVEETSQSIIVPASRRARCLERTALAKAVLSPVLNTLKQAGFGKRLESGLTCFFKKCGNS